MSSTSSSRSRSGKQAQAALIALLVGLLLGIVLIWIIGGNPFSDANEVRYTDVAVASVNQTQGEICWKDEGADRDAPATCGILALDPQGGLPSEGDTVTLGVVNMETPDGQTPMQVVYASGGSPASTPASPEASPSS